MAQQFPTQILLFQSTPSSRRATKVRLRPIRDEPISTHALLAEGDAYGENDKRTDQWFQPTPSSRRATLYSLSIPIR